MHPSEPNHPHGVFHRQYEQGAPWDIGRPQPAYVAIEEAGALGERVLEVGCGRGDLTLYLAQRGHWAVGLDVVGSAIETARSKAAERAVDARFEVADILDAGSPGFPEFGAGFDDVVDVGFFHALSDADRIRLLEALSLLLRPGGTYRFLCFSDKVPGQWGPRRITEAEIRMTFAGPGWRVVEIAASELETARPDMPRVPAWLATIERVAE